MQEPIPNTFYLITTDFEPATDFEDASAQLEPSAISKEAFFGLLNFLLSTGSKVCKVCKGCSIVD